MTKPKEIVITFTKRPFVARAAPMGWPDCFLAEKPKMGELQMDWLRSEDLKEEKNVTTSTLSITGADTMRGSFPCQ